MDEHIAGLREALKHARQMETYYLAEVMKVTCWEGLLHNDNAVIAAEAKRRTGDFQRLRESADMHGRSAAAVAWALSVLAPELEVAA